MIRFGTTVFLLFCFVENVWSAEPGFVDNQSCATATCHGNTVGRGPVWNHSLSKFVLRDPHAQAGRVLYSELSQGIVRRLNPKAVHRSVEYDVVLRRRCISCHTTSTPEQCESDQKIDPKMIVAGVSCQSCHGPAGDWLDEHLGSDFVGAERFQSTSMRDTESVIGRTETCVRCHVGDRRDGGLVRDMNHDLIAAGHPALRFDLLIYSDSLPKHWDPSGTPTSVERVSRIAARDVSRSINLAAVAELAADRGADFLAGKDVPWPELSDYDCFACHQTLKSYRPRTSLLKISLGLPVWNSWHTIGQVELYNNKKLLAGLSPHRSDPRRVEASARKLADTFREKAATRIAEDVDPSVVLRMLLSDIRRQAPFDWHHAAIDYLRMRAAIEDLGGRAELISELDGVEQLLRFSQPESNSSDVQSQTADQKIVPMQSPKRFDADLFRERVVQRIIPLTSDQ